MKRRNQFLTSLFLAVFMVTLCFSETKKNTTAPESKIDDGTIAKIDALEKQLDRGINQLQTQMQAQNQGFANTAYHHILIASAFMALATMFVVGVTIFTGFNLSASRADFKEHITRLEKEFRDKLTEHTDRSQKEVSQLETELHDRISQVRDSTNDLNEFRNSMQKEFSEKMSEFAAMKAGFQPASEIKQTLVNEMRTEFQKPETLRHETMRQIVLLMLDNPSITEQYKEILENELKRLDDTSTRPPAH